MYECNYDVTQDDVLVMLSAAENWNGVESFLVNISFQHHFSSHAYNIMCMPVFILYITPMGNTFLYY